MEQILFTLHTAPAGAGLIDPGSAVGPWYVVVSIGLLRATRR